MILKTMKDVGMSVRAARTQRGFTQAQFAEKLGTNQEWISQFENGRLENPSLRTVLKAFALLGVDLRTGSPRGNQPGETRDTGDLALDEPSFLRRLGR